MGAKDRVGIEDDEVGGRGGDTEKRDPRAAREGRGEEVGGWVWGGRGSAAD